MMQVLIEGVCLPFPGSPQRRIGSVAVLSYFSMEHRILCNQQPTVCGHGTACQTALTKCLQRAENGMSKAEDYTNP